MIELRYYQAEVEPKVTAYIEKNPGKHPLVALPTGSGKSYCIADLIDKHPDKKILILSHVKEILSQNYESITKYCGIDLGLYSAGLKSKTIKRVTVAGVQSAIKVADKFSDFDIVVIDEAHRIPIDTTTMYRRLLNHIPRAVYVGYTATPYRLGHGKIYGDDGLFDDLVVDYTKKHKFMQLVKKGYLAPLTAESTAVEMDTSDIKLQGGDFSLKELSDKFDKTAITESILDEICKKGADRKQWMIFAIDIDHANHIAESLIRRGIKTAVVHSKMAHYGFDRDKVIKDVKDNRYRCVVNVDVLTTGFDHPQIDLIATLRSTKSPVLHCQILGRGCRIHSSKSDCLILDFANNVATLGPINDIHVAVKGKGKGGGEPIMRACPECDLLSHASVRKCPRCGYIFPRHHHLVANAANLKIIDDGKQHWVKVDRVEYVHNQNMGRPSTMIVEYHCGARIIRDHICADHRGFAKTRADHWVKFRGGVPGKTIDAYNQRELYPIPSAIKVIKKGRFYDIVESSY